MSEATQGLPPYLKVTLSKEALLLYRLTPPPAERCAAPTAPLELSDSPYRKTTSRTEAAADTNSIPAPPAAWPLTIVIPETDALAAMLSLVLNSQPRSTPRQSCQVTAEPASEATLRDCGGRRVIAQHANNGRKPRRSGAANVRTLPAMVKPQLPGPEKLPGKSRIGLAGVASASAMAPHGALNEPHDGAVAPLGAANTAPTPSTVANAADHVPFTEAVFPSTL